ncbi:MAG TPA: hypothetical protein VFA52_02735 [Candidatus Paceibacterota bacterium]|nr:hypothetical protein [Candidatus Paceibacterota bacterium]
MEKYLLFEVVGDPSKDLAGTAVVSNLALKYPDRKIIVTTLFPEVWLHHPSVFRVYKLGNTQYFFDDYIEKKDTLIFRLDPFLTENFIYRRKHIIEIWSDLCNVPYEIKIPQIYFTAREREATEKMTKRPKPLFFFETRALLNTPPFDIWKAVPKINSLPFSTIMAVVTAMQKEGFHPIHIKRLDEPELSGIEWINLPIRQLLCAVKLGAENLFLNSFMMQAAAADMAAATIISDPADWRVWGYENLDHLSTSSSADIIQNLIP